MWFDRYSGLAQEPTMDGDDDGEDEGAQQGSPVHVAKPMGAMVDAGDAGEDNAVETGQLKDQAK